MMQIRTETVHIENKKILPEESILLDIETTGLSPEFSAVFMIGCIWTDGKDIRRIQWLADSLELHGEQEILSAFSKWICTLLKKTGTLCLSTYNGRTFDLPFLNIRYAQCHLENPLQQPSIINRDLYREILPLKALFPVQNMKLKSIAEWAGYKRSQSPDGRRLIKAYHDYIKTKDSDLLNLLFLHNTDDLNSLSALLPFRAYHCFFNGTWENISCTAPNQETLCFYLQPEISFPAALSYSSYDCRLELYPQEGLLYVPVTDRGLKYYYSDIREYVYLPAEDTAIHKSMASYIDRSHWVKVSKENCYTWFLPDSSFMQDKQRQRDYVQMLFGLFGFTQPKTP